MPLPFILVGVAVVAGFISSECSKRDDLNEKISRLKRKLGRAKSRRPGKFLVTPQSPTSEVLFPKGSERVEIKSEDDNFELSVSKIQDPGWQKWDTSDASINRLSPLVSALPLVGVANHIYSTNYMIVEASGPLARAKGGGFRALVHGSDGKVTEHAKLHNSQIGGVMIPVVIWTAASAILAQKHLHDISRRLAKISADISKISQFQQNERLGGIFGDYQYLADLIEVLENSPEAMDDKKFGVVEDVFRKTYSSHNHLLSDIQNFRIDPEDMKTASESLGELAHLVAQIFLVFQIKIQCFRLQELYNPDINTISNRLDRLRNEIKKVPQLVNRKFDDFLDRKISAWDNFEDRIRVNKEIKISSREFEALFDYVAKTYNDMSRAAFLIANQKQQLLLKMDGERIVGISDCN